MKIQSILCVALLATALATSFSVAAGEQDAVVAKTLYEKTYLNGGIGKDERDFMRNAAHDYSLRLTFSERKSGEFVVDIPVDISDADGNTVFKIPDAGPLLYVMLPKGKYKISASFNGLTYSQEATLGGKVGMDLYFHWNAVPKQ